MQPKDKRLIFASLCIPLGTVLGALLGGFLFVRNVLQSNQHDNGSPGAGIGIVLFLFWGTIVAVIVGALVGKMLFSIPFLILSLPNRSDKKPISLPSAKSVAITVATIAACVVVLYGLLIIVAWKKQDREYAERHAYAMAHQQRQTIPVAAPGVPQTGQPKAISNNTTSGPLVKPTSLPSPAPAVAATPLSVAPDIVSKVTAAYGDLVYPNGQIIFPNAQTNPANSPHPEIPCSFAAIQSSDDYEKTVGYYRSRVSMLTEIPTAFTGVTQRASDGRQTYVHVEQSGGVLLVKLSAL